MSGPRDDAAPMHIRQVPRRREDASGIADFTTLVTVPGRPDAVRAFTDSEGAEATSYAHDTGGTIVALPLSTPLADNDAYSVEVPNSGSGHD